MNGHDECGSVREWLPDHAAGRLDQVRSARVDGHVASCEECREELDLIVLLRAGTPGVASRGFSITGTARGLREGSDESGAVKITVRHRTDTLELDVAGADGEIDGSIRLDGALFATISGPSDDPVFLGADGNPLRPGEVLVLFRVVDTLEDVFDLLEDLLDPVDELVLLGFIL